MQVADMTNKASAAVLGAQQTRAVSMVEDAGFLMMLSSNLYSNQLLAAAREPLCNAWDAHIEAGKTDIPIKVTITENNEFILQDFGLGIPDDKIEVIYGTYGGSTKRNDSKTTGGFGLGSKAPWAIVDTFRVTSCHAGIKTVYSMSRACLENKGKPGITPVVTNLPTNDTGLTVSFMLKQDQVEEVARYITYIAMHGDMCVDFTYEGETKRLSTIGLGTTPGSYDANPNQWYHRYMGDHEVFIRYGSVVYPVLKTPATEKAVGMLEDFINIIGVPRIIVQAAPDTLALTPSREALSSQTMTENGIVNLCVDLVTTMEKDIVAQVPIAVEQTLQRIRQGKTIDLNDFNLGHNTSGMSYINNYVVRKYLMSRLGKTLRDKYEVAFKQAERAANKLYFPTGKNKTKGSEALKRVHLKALTHSMHRHTVAKELYTRYVVAPIVTALRNVNLDISSLYIAGSRWYSLELSKYKKDHMSYIKTEEMFSVLRTGIKGQVVFLTSRVANSVASIEASPHYTKNCSYWTIRIKPNMKPEEKQPLLDALYKLNYTVVDLTLNHSWDPVVQERKAAAANKPPKEAKVKERTENVLISVNDYISNGKWDKVVNRSTATDMSSSKSLKFFIEDSDIPHAKDNLGAYFKLGWATKEDLEGGVVTTNGIERRMAESRGAIPVNDYFLSRFIKLAKDPALVTYFTTRRKRSIREDWDISSQTIKLCKLMGIKLPGYDKMTHDPKLEQVWSIAYRFRDYLQQLEQETDPESIYFEELAALKLRELPFITKLVTLENDIMLRDLTRHKSIFQWLTLHPERATALKSLVLSALKSGKNKP